MPSKLAITWSGKTTGTAQTYALNRALTPCEIDPPTMGLENMANPVMVSITPRTISSGSPVMLASASTTIAVPARNSDGTSSVTTVRLQFTDASSKQVIGEDTVIQPVQTTDFRIWERSDGTGAEYTTNTFVIVSAVVAATYADIVITNALAIPLYIIGLQIRGNTITQGTVVVAVAEDATAIKAKGGRARPIQLPYGTAGGQVYADALAAATLDRFKYPFLECMGIALDAESIAGSSDNMLAVPIGSVINLTDPRYFTAVGHGIIGIEVSIRPDAFQSLNRLKGYTERLDEYIYSKIGRAHV